MKFKFPVIFNEMPTEETLAQYGCRKGKHLIIGLRIAKKSHMRIRLAEAQNWKCCWCGNGTIPETNKKNTATIEHITPLSKGGLDEWENMASACSTCNNNRGNMAADEFLARKDLHADFAVEDRQKLSRERRYIRKVEKLIQRGWTRTDDVTGVLKKLNPVEWVESINESQEFKNKITKIIENAKSKIKNKDEPTRILDTGRQQWLNDEGYLHRVDGPAVIYPNGDKEWYFNGQLHREDGPAVEWVVGRNQWYKHGQRHRIGGPAIEYEDGPVGWYQDNKQHREDGPTSIQSSGMTWHFEGFKLCFDEWLDKLPLSYDEKIMLKLQYG